MKLTKTKSMKVKDVQYYRYNINLPIRIVRALKWNHGQPLDAFITPNHSLMIRKAK